MKRCPHCYAELDAAGCCTDACDHRVIQLPLRTEKHGREIADTTMKFLGALARLRKTGSY